MKILLTNDDSIHSPGLVLLAQKLGEFADVFIVAPRTEQSGVSQSITFLRPLFPQRIDDVFLTKGLKGYTVDGTPTDCVKLGLFKLCPWKPDLVISGINGGLNAGTNVHYSGTVAGAIAGATFGFQSFALSAEYESTIDFESHVDIAVPLIQRFASVELAENSLLNINVPTAALNGDADTEIVPVETNPLGYDFEKGVDPKGREYFWANCKPDPQPSPFPTDCSVLAEGKISVSPLLADINFQSGIDALKMIDV